ncbi:hypothetical protein EB796_002172 [Bugula neritina]|uniref:Uncharacterized protein n=1 Tax=Bugula neritina TaxID=10212 RepID=A0A7J7KMY4_BUGNE|nr:hypothetical protein EB796_002172 [Bugula neritina]
MRPKNRAIIILGSLHICTGVFLIGLVIKNIADTYKAEGSSPGERASSAAPLVTGLLAIFCGGFEVMDMFYDDSIKILHTIGTTVATTASASLLWKYSIIVYECNKTLLSLRYRCIYSEQTIKVHHYLLAFTVVSFFLGSVGVAMSAAALKKFFPSSKNSLEQEMWPSTLPVAEKNTIDLSSPASI